MQIAKAQSKMTVEPTPIWFSPPNLELLNTMCKHTACESLGIQITEAGHNYIRGTMPADSRTFQPLGLVHGGANVLLAETLGSIGANLIVDTSKYYCVGQEINANHLRGVRSGIVTGTATLYSCGSFFTSVGHSDRGRSRQAHLYFTAHHRGCKIAVVKIAKPD